MTPNGLYTFVSCNKFGKKEIMRRTKYRKRKCRRIKFIYRSKSQSQINRNRYHEMNRYD